MRLWRGAILVVVWLLPLVSTNAKAQEFAGPIPLRNQFPLTAAHLSLMPESAFVVEKGRLQASFGGAWSNTFILKDAYEVDAESVELRPRGEVGIGEGTQLSIELPFVWMGGGVLDDAIDGWHAFWGFPRGHRGDRASDEFLISGVTDKLSGFGLNEAGLRMGNPMLGLKTVIARGAESQAALISEVSLPKMTSGYAHQGVDVSIGAVLSTLHPWGALHYGGALVAYSSESYSGIPVTPLHGEFFASAERPVSTKVSLLATLLGASKTITSIAEFPDYSLYLDLGVRGRLSDTCWLVAALRENPAPHNGTTDVSFFSSLSFRLK